jgi:Zn finger protein HypA/HybF involved in hydrogenase expression
MHEAAIIEEVIRQALQEAEKNRQTEATAPSFSCPACRSTDIRILSGNELILAHIEGEQDEGS